MRWGLGVVFVMCGMASAWAFDPVTYEDAKKSALLAVEKQGDTQLVVKRKAWNAETGETLPDVTEPVSVELCDEHLEDIDGRIADLQAQRAGWAALKADLEALK